MELEKSKQASFFTAFKESIEGIKLPSKFTFPFYYDPHPLSLIAAKELQNYIENQTDWEHEFGCEEKKVENGIGKMFGVLVVQNIEGKIGYLSAFSGKLAGGNHHKRFVPPVFDSLEEGGFLNNGMFDLNGMHSKIKDLEEAPSLLEKKRFFKREQEEAEKCLSEGREQIRLAKKDRKQQRIEGEQKLTENELNELLEKLAKESVFAKYQFKTKVADWQKRVQIAEESLQSATKEIEDLREVRRAKSNHLQQQLFDSYCFLNKDKVERSLWDIFKDTVYQIPPAGAGECAAPKLIQYAFENELKPICMAEFWWGQSPNSEIRKQGQFYPACKGKCEPILGHMLQGVEMDENPLLENSAVGKKIEILFEDDEMLVINKPTELLSVPGKSIVDSVYTRMKEKYPEATGSLIVHRLDMSTSGIMLIAKSEKTHKYLQQQFIRRKIKKRYIALLDGEIKEESGEIKLPLRQNFDDRPRQMVCFEHGKVAETYWEKITIVEGKTRIRFFPITGRTHQLRMHASHNDGLNAPIVGDDLYGVKGGRLHLHAEYIQFKHPVSREEMTIQVDPEF